MKRAAVVLVHTERGREDRADLSPGPHEPGSGDIRGTWTVCGGSGVASTIWSSGSWTSPGRSAGSIMMNLMNRSCLLILQTLFWSSQLCQVGQHKPSCLCADQKKKKKRKKKKKKKKIF